jgi:hypothetical protein
MAANGLGSGSIIAAPCPSQRAQIIRHIAELSQHGRIAEITRGWITCAAERDCACMTQYFPKTLGAFYSGSWAWTFNGFANNDAASATSNGNATKYVIPAMAYLLSTETLLYCFRVFAHRLVGEANEDWNGNDQ